jgi:hypothetical protein
MRTKSESQHLAAAAAGLGLLVLVLLGDLLLTSGDTVLSSERGDIAYYFARIRGWAFGELARGNLPLWNPHLFAGTPLVGGFQAGLLYPPNVIYLVLPLARAINLDAALHLFLVGFFTFAWVRGRGVDALGAFFAGALIMLCGATVFRVMAGQLSLLAGNAWTPLVFLVVDRLVERPTRGWCLVGIAALTLQILAGYPFCVFATGLVGGLYAALSLPRAPSPLRTVAALAVLGAAPLLLSAAQLWIGVATSAESTRAGGTDALFATSFSLPLENMITVLVPGFYGDLLRVNYWGRWWIWDASIFLGAPALALAMAGVHYGRRDQVRFAGGLALLLLLLSLGRETPLYDWLHAWVPGFDRFRAPSKFAFHFSLLVALLAGIGIHHLRESARGSRALAAGLAGLAAALGGFALWIRHQVGAEDGGAWSDLVMRVGTAWVHTPEFVVETADYAVAGLWQAAAVAGLAAVALALRPGRRWTVELVLGLALLELLAFGRAYRAEFRLSDLPDAELAAFHRAHPGTHRFLTVPRGTFSQENQALEDGVLSMWGYDPVQLERYVRFVLAARKDRHDFPTPPVLQIDGPTAYHPLFALVRTRFSFTREGKFEHDGALERFQLLRDYRVVPRDDVLRVLEDDPSLDPHRTVLLEEAPVPAPDPDGQGGSVRLLDESSDHLTLEVRLDSPAILLVSDAYSTGWRARPAGPSAQERYDVLPADYVLRAVPLAAGEHEIRMEYAPLAWRAGRWVSALSAVVFAGVVVLHFVRARRRARP